MRNAPPMVPGIPLRKVNASIPCLLRGAGDAHVQRGSSGPHAIARLQRRLREALAQADDDARHAAVAHQKVGADADDIDRHIVRRSP